MFIRSRRMLVNILLAICLFVPGAAAASAQSTGSVDVRIWTINTSDSSVFDVCYTLVGYSNLGCDENQDGAVLFEDIPYGEYQVQPSYPNGSDYEVAPFTIVVNAGNSDFTAIAAPRGMTSVDVRIWTFNMSSQPVYDVCYELAGYSNVGCDENRDGAVLFEDIPFDNYLVVASYPDSSDHRVAPFHIDVTASQTDFTATAESRNNQVPVSGLIQDTTELYLITRDPDTGEKLTGACYELVGYSNVGCDENNDGRVRFADIPFSTYTIRQTSAPAGYQLMPDYTVSIMPMDIGPSTSILLVQDSEQAPRDRYNVSVVFYDSDTKQIVVDQETCAQLRNDNGPLTLVGCDDGIIDGQVDFVHVAWDPEGDDRIGVELACPYEIAPGAEQQLLWVGQHTFFLFVEVETTTQRCN